jgi:DNA-binding MarR family transcriptional regulator
VNHADDDFGAYDEEPPTADDLRREAEDERAWNAGELDWTAPGLTGDEVAERRRRVGRMYREGRLGAGGDPFDPFDQSNPFTVRRSEPADRSAPPTEDPVIETSAGPAPARRSALPGPRPPRRRRFRQRSREVPESLHHWTGFAAMAAAHRAERSYGAALTDVGLSVPDFLALAVVAQRPEISVSAIAFRLGMSQSRASDLVLHLEGSGWVERIPSPAVLRRKVLIVTRDGAIAFEDASSAIASADADWQVSLVKSERTALRAALLRLAPNSSNRVGRFTHQ